MHIVSSLAISLAIALRALRSGSLTRSGAIAATVVGTIHTLPQSLMWMLMLMVFFGVGSWATKLTSPCVVRQYKKQAKDSYVRTSEDINRSSGDNGKTKKAGGRTWHQVLANGLLGTVLCALDQGAPALGISEPWRAVILIGFLSHYATTTADTLSSELGILSSSPPILITTLKSVPRGTNGGVSPLGLLAAVLGGGLMGLIATLFTRRPELLIWGILAGVAGSLVDSLLGATVQATKYDAAGKVVEAHGGGKVAGKLKTAGRDWLDNNQVNFVSSLFTSISAMALYAFLHPGP